MNVDNFTGTLGQGAGAKFVTRRQIVLRIGASAIALAGGGFASLSLRASARDAAIVPDAAELEAFMRFSMFATGHEHLSPALGARLFDALAELDHLFKPKLLAIARIIEADGHRDVEALEIALKSRSILHEMLMAVIKAWYSGVVSEGTGATVYAFETALMYQPARDQVVIPTFAHGGPNYWVRSPPKVEDMPIF